jgi:hypothetical protein
LAASGTRLVLVKVVNIESVYGNDVKHYAHKADIVRLEALRFAGGIYLDVDVLLLRGEYDCF